MSKHTPGPWLVGPDQGYGEVAGTQIVDCETDYVLALAIGDVEELPHAANGRLIAAAPELLDALEIMVRIFPKFDPDRHPVLADDIQAARAAIAKAKGKPA